MKKIRRLIALAMAFVMVIALAACGSSPKTDGDKEEVKTTSASGDVVKVEVPAGWCLVSGPDMNGASGADYICHAAEYELGDPYLQTTKDDRDIGDVQAVLESEDPFGAYSGEKELDNGTWYIAENAAAAQIGDKVLLVLGYECDFSSDEVQSILGSLQWVN